MTQRSESRAAECQAEPAHQKRWLIAAAATLMQGAVGATYAWSVFRDPLAAQHGWTISEVTLAYSLNLFGLGIFAFLGGLWMPRVDPKTVGVVAGLLYGLGLALAGLAGDRLWALYLGFGVVAGVGRGLGWVVPMAMVVKWFPDRRGLITGVSLAGNGVGALVAAPVATVLIETIGVLPTFTVSGIALLVLVAGPALVMREPPDEYCPPGWAAGEVRPGSRAFTLGEALRTPQWFGLWGLLFLSSTAGLALFSHAAPMARELTGVGALAAAGVVVIMSVANVVGRLCWAWLSDLVGRRLVFAALLVLLAVVLRLLPHVPGLAAFATLVAVAMFCFGGGLGTMPAFAADYFGPKYVGPIVGLLMTAQGTAALFGPLLLASARETSGSYVPALSTLGATLALAVVLPFALRPPGGPSVDVRVTMQIPGTTRFGSASSSQGRCHQELEAVTCPLDTPLAPGSRATIFVSVTPWSPVSIVSTARVVADEPDPVASNNTASLTTAVYPSEDSTVSPAPLPFHCPRPFPRPPYV